MRRNLVKTIIIYGSKHNFTKDMAYELKERISADVVDVKEKAKINFDEYDLVIVGTPIYMGRILKSISKFINQNLEVLKKKKSAFFITGIGEPKEMTGLFEAQVNHDVFEHASVIGHFGGELRPDNAQFIMKAIVKRMLQEAKFNKEKNIDEISIFVDKIKEIKA